MSRVPPKTERSQQARPDASGKPTFDWTLTSSSRTDIVKLVAGPFDVLPVIFVPGIMGSNLKSVGTKNPGPVWRLDKGTMGVPWGLLKGFASKGPGPRQQLLHPARTFVDNDGAVPSDGKHSAAIYKDRGWGEVGEGSYHDFLLWLDDHLNPSERNPALWHEYYQTEATISAPPKPGDKPKLFPGVDMGLSGQPFGAEIQPFVSIQTDELIARAKLAMPVYACGYNWLDDNDAAAERLQQRIIQTIKSWNQGAFRCQQVILITHSMGGLVARACVELTGMADKIAGVVHGVMPANGAAVAYRRCKIGMRDEDFGAGLVIGSTGQEVTAVFAQAPGALQLLPSQRYTEQWLRVLDDKGQTILSLPKDGKTAYDSIYREKKQWWGLVNEKWLSPTEGAPIKWNQYLNNIQTAEDFHAELAGKFHPNSYVFYGADGGKQKSFEKVYWRMRTGFEYDKKSSPTAATVKGMRHDDLRISGSNPAYVGGETKVAQSYGMGPGAVYETSDWTLHCEMQDGIGDGTVPCSSGAAPKTDGGARIKQQFKLTGFGHEPAYHDPQAQRATLYAINKIVGAAKRSA